MGSLCRSKQTFSRTKPDAGKVCREKSNSGRLSVLKQILAPGARICFKTDNRPLFDFSLQTFPASGFVLENVCFDLHNDPMNETNIETEYERKFSEKGFTINRLEAYLPL
jgi:tRNA (guanine-N7-)-methyltransferase